MRLDDFNVSSIKTAILKVRSKRFNIMYSTLLSYSESPPLKSVEWNQTSLMLDQHEELGRGRL